NPAASAVIKKQAVANVEITNDIIGTESEIHEKIKTMNYFKILVFLLKTGTHEAILTMPHLYHIRC
ncbi:hypothetical protein J0J30_23920, partial [Vibrio vulnificus]|nr:hypothetical protein [Vibrio vulnificus]